MTTLSQWFSKKARWPLVTYTFVAMFIQILFFAYTIAEHNHQIESRIKSQVKNVVSVGVGQHNREIIESSMSVIVDELGASSIFLCDGNVLLFGYPQKPENCSKILPKQWFEKVVSDTIEGTDYSIQVSLPKFDIPWTYFYLNLFVAVFLAFGLFLIYRMQKAVANDLLSPILNEIFGEKKLIIQELEDIRQSHLEKKKMENEQAISETKEKISRQVAHDIQSPLGALKIAKESYGDNQEVASKLMDRSLKRIDDIISDLLVKNKESKKLEAINLNEILEEIIQEKLSEYRSRKIEIKQISEVSQRGLFVAIDRTKILRVLSNLINNSVEAVEEGCQPKIEISMKTGDKQIRLMLKDNGVGIAPDDLKKVIAYGFTRGKKNGSGMGLAHAEKTLRESGGDLLIESEQGVGTQISLFLLRY